MSQAAPAHKHDPVAFAHLLRGLSAISVLVFHYLLMFWQRPARVAELTGMPAMPTGAEAFPGHQVFLAWLPFNLGAIAVGALFLLSGFVLPYSFRPDTTRASFVISRCFRILPTYWGGFVVSCGLVALVAWYSGHAFPYTLKDVGLHLLPGPRDLLGGATIDGVVWTLDVEMKFYALAFLFAPWLKSGSRWVLLMPLGLFLAAAACVWKGIAVYPTLAYLLFASIGIVFHWLFKRTMRVAEAATWISLGTGMYFWILIRWLEFPPSLVGSYGLAFAAFVLAYLMRDKIELNRITRKLADVSYPLYCVHAVLGYVVIRALILLGVPALVAIALSAALALTMATLLHRYLEVPSPGWGRQVVARLLAGQRPQTSGLSPDILKNK